MSQEIQTSEYLTESEEQRLESQEAQIINFGNLALENARKAGEILDDVKREGSFKKKRKNSDFPAFNDFGEYAKARFGRGKTMSHNYIHISRIMKAMEQEGFDPLELGSIQNAMQIYFELKKLGYYKRGRLHPLFREVLSKGMTITENISTIVEETGEIKITPDSIHAAFETVQEIVVNNAYEIDGQQIPMSLGQVAVDDQASQKMYEEIQRRRIESNSEVQNKMKRRFTIRTSSEIDVTQDGKKKEEVTLSCPKHGLTSGNSLTVAGIKMVCGCFAILETTKDWTKLVWYESTL